MLNREIRSDRKNKNIIGMIQSCLILILVLLIIMIMVQITRLQGTARVINYAGLVRGATQRMVKLEITGSRSDELIKYLDDILSGLRYQDGHYDLVKLHDKEYQDKLQVQSDYWEKLKIEIEAVRSNGYQNTDIVNMSEIYFHTYRNLPYPITSAVCRFLHPLSVPIRMHSRSGFDLHYYLICLFLCLSFVTVPQSPFYLYGKSQP